MRTWRTALLTAAVTSLIMTLALAAKPCLKAENLISCLVDTCKLTKCPGDPTATCKMVEIPCEGCKRVWYSASGEVARCSRKSDKMPPSGGDIGCRQVPCSIDICVNKRCPAEPKAVCRPDGCNKCRPAWFLNDRRIDCQTGEYLPDKPIVGSPHGMSPMQRECSPFEVFEPCDMSICNGKICRNFPEAQCRPDGCGKCKDTWYVNNEQVDCLSDGCAPNVPTVKCVDDPCKYFGHHCPGAECRATQCGRCEAKFFANGQEVDCAMPPKECPANVQPRSCPWYTCPANICPSNLRLMCRIDPCGNTCKYEFIDIYNGEPMLCRVFDGDGTQPDTGFQTDLPAPTDGSIISAGKPPLLGDLVTESEPFGLALPGGAFSLQTTDTGMPLGNEGEVATKKSATKGSGGFNVEPVFINPGPPITDPSLLSLLSSFPHEMSLISSASIQKALKKESNVIVDKGVRPGVLVPATPVDSPIVSPRFDMDQPQPKKVVDKPAIKPTGGHSIKSVLSGNANVLDNHLLDLASKDPHVLSLSSKQTGTKGSVKESPASNTKINKDVIYPELKNIGTGFISAGKPAHINSHKLGQKAGSISKPNTSKKTDIIATPKIAEKEKPAAVKVTVPKKVGGGLPISVQLFNQWAFS